MAVRLKLLPQANHLLEECSHKEIFDYMQEHRTASKEQFLSLIIHYYNIESLTLDSLHLYEYWREDICTALEEKGIIEIYQTEDYLHDHKMIALSYESLALMDKIPEITNVDKILITLPEYIAQLKGVTGDEPTIDKVPSDKVPSYKKR